MKSKLSSRRGETLIEVLVAVLVVALSAAMLATMIAAAVNINIKADSAVSGFYEELSAAEGDAVPYPTSAVVDGTDVNINAYTKGDGALYAYERRIS